MKSPFLLCYGFAYDDNKKEKYINHECRNEFNRHPLVFPDSVSVKKKLDTIIADAIATIELNLRYKVSNVFR